MDRLNCNIEFIEELCVASPQRYKKRVKSANEEEIKCIYECLINAEKLTRKFQSKIKRIKKKKFKSLEQLRKFFILSKSFIVPILRIICKKNVDNLPSST